MPRALIIGGGLAGMSAALALHRAGFEVELYEARPRLGGRAGSFPLDPARPEAGLMDNGQHILLGCCRNLLDFYGRLGVADCIRFYDEFHFLQPGGRLSVLRPGRLPGAGRYAAALLGLRFLGVFDKLAVTRALLGLRREFARRTDLDDITMLEWLRGHGQTPAALSRFWRPVLVSALNEEPERTAARHGLQVFWLGFLAAPDGHRMGLPAVPLSDLYAEQRWRRFPEVKLHVRSPVRALLIEQRRVRGVQVGRETRRADYYVLAVPCDRAAQLAPDLNLPAGAFESSPIAAVHLWFDRPVMELPQAALLDRTFQWVFNKAAGRYLMAIMSAARHLLEQPREQVIALARRELADFLPRLRQARLERAQLITERRATFSPRPGLEALRPPAATALPNLFLAGDWTRTGWPATMEGAVRSGYLAAEAVTAAAGAPRRFLVPDPEP